MPCTFQPILEYEWQASTPYFWQDIDLIERLQRLGTHMVKDRRNLRQLSLFTIERRLLRRDLIRIYNLFQGRLYFPLVELLETPTEEPPQLLNRRFSLPRKRIAFSVSRVSDGISHCHIYCCLQKRLGPPLFPTRPISQNPLSTFKLFLRFPCYGLVT